MTVIPMSMTCSSCGHTVVNDMGDVKHPLEFLQALRERGWFIPDTSWPSPRPTSGEKPHRCSKCVASSS